MTFIKAELTNERRAGLLFDEFPTKAHDAILARVTQLTEQLEGKVLGRVPVATGALLAEVHSFVDDRETKIAGKVKVIAGGGKSAHGKVAALEYGAHGRFQVNAYTRKISTVFGRAVAPTSAFIDAYSRQANIAEHRFLRGALDEMRAQIAEELNAAIASIEGAA